MGRGGKAAGGRERRLIARRERLVSRAAEQRVEPYHPPAAAAQGLKRRRERLRLARVPAVAQDHEHGAAVGQIPPLLRQAREARAHAGAPPPAPPLARPAAQPPPPGPLPPPPR